MDHPDDSADLPEAMGAILPSEFMRQLRPDEFSDSGSEPAFILEAYELEQRLEYVTARNETHDFEIFCRKLCERIICPNLKLATGPEGGGDSKADSETFAVADEIATLHYVGEANSGSERWAFAFSAKKQWQQKARSDIEGIAGTGRPYTKVFVVTSRYGRSKDVAKIQDELSEKFGFRVEIFDRSWIIDRVLTHGNQDIAVDYLGVGKRNEKARVGPADYARSQQLEDLEKAIQDPAAYAGIEAQRMTDALLAATLSKELERPPFETHAHQRDDMRSDAALIHVERGVLDRAVLPSKNAAGSRFDEIPFAHLGDIEILPDPARLLCGIFARGDLAQLNLRELAGLLDRHHSEAPDLHSPNPAFLIHILDDEGFRPGCADTDTETFDLGIPKKCLACRWCSQRIDRPLIELCKRHKFLHHITRGWAIRKVIRT